MKAMVTAIALAATAFLPSAPGMAADEVPKFDVRPSCRGASAQTDAGMAACMEDEERARQQLATEWAKFPGGDKAACVREASDIPELRSYVELLTCLQIARDARELPKEK